MKIKFKDKHNDFWKILSLVLLLLVIISFGYNYSVKMAENAYNDGLIDGSNSIIQNILANGKQCQSPLIIGSGNSSTAFVWAGCLQSK